MLFVIFALPLEKGALAKDYFAAQLLLELAVARAGERGALADAQVFGCLAVHTGFLGNVGFCLFRVMLRQPRLEVRFPTLPAIAKRDRILAVPLLSGADQPVTAALAPAAVALKGTDANPRGNGAIIGLADPFFG
jgi:hypothetical protein